MELEWYHAIPFQVQRYRPRVGLLGDAGWECYCCWRTDCKARKQDERKCKQCGGIIGCATGDNLHVFDYFGWISPDGKQFVATQTELSYIIETLEKGASSDMQKGINKKQQERDRICECFLTSHAFVRSLCTEFGMADLANDLVPMLCDLQAAHERLICRNSNRMLVQVVKGTDFRLTQTHTPHPASSPVDVSRLSPAIAHPNQSFPQDFVRVAFQARDGRKKHRIISHSMIFPFSPQPVIFLAITRTPSKHGTPRKSIGYPVPPNNPTILLPAHLKLPAIHRLAATPRLAPRDVVLKENTDDADNPIEVLLNGYHFMDPITDFIKAGTIETWPVDQPPRGRSPDAPAPSDLPGREPADVQCRRLHHRLACLSGLGPDYAQAQRFQLPHRAPDFTGSGGDGLQGYREGIPRFRKTRTRAQIALPETSLLDFDCPDQSFGHWVYHCHILEHEENDMMRPFEVVP